MLSIFATVAIGVLLGAVTGGSLKELPHLRIRWAWMALVGVALQFAPLSGTPGYAVLLASFGFLLAFGLGNLDRPGFFLVLAGLCLNTLVIAVNHGMPVTREALTRSNQAALLPDLIAHGGAKHHLAGEHTRLLVLADVIGVPSPIAQAVSMGDICVHVGIAWYIVGAMKPERYPMLATPKPSPRMAI
jgi:hypothetical protein